MTAEPVLPKPSILFVDDEAYILRSLTRSLRNTAFVVRTANSAREALAMLEDKPADLVIADYNMPEMNGVDFLCRVREKWPLTQRIMLTGFADQQAVEDAINKSEVHRFLTKPWDENHLITTLRSAAEQHRLAEENARLHELTARKNRELEELTRTLEERVQQRTGQLLKAKMEWEKSFDAITDPLAIIGRDRVIRRANVAYAHAGLQDVRAVKGMKCHEALFGRSEPCPACPLDRVGPMSEGGFANIDVGRASYKLVVYPLGADEAVCSYRDQSSERAYAQQLVQSEKMAAVGQLAAGVAHEINNPLAAILAFAQLMKVEPERNAADLEALGLIETSAMRCKKIVEALLRFVRRPQSVVSEEVDLNRLCDEAVQLIRPQTKSRPVEFKIEVPETPVRVMGVQNHLAQVLINLMQNAVQAVSKNGVIGVGARVEGEEAVLYVSDNGCGIPAEIQSRIWEPFFTTKPEGIGTGLGLSITHRIVEEHGGTISVESEPDRGATFTIRLPIVGAATAAAA